MNPVHCPVIHGALTIDLHIQPNKVYAYQCCLRPDTSKEIVDDNIWQSPTLIPMREVNSFGIWDKGCWHCRGNENAGLESFRSGMLNKFGVRSNLSGPQRLDLKFDIGCNLACRSCGPYSSTYWQKHLIQNNIPMDYKYPSTSRADDMIEILKTLDLSNLEMVVFCGGETLLGQGYWKVTEAIAELCPQSKEKITLCFQTNGTQPINENHFKTIEKFHLIKLNISLDGIGDKFEYLRWPANWNQVVDNIQNLKQTLPANVMFLIEETTSIFNLYYQHELKDWVNKNYSVNRLSDIINHTHHPAFGHFSLDNMSQEYVDAIINTDLGGLIKPDWKENALQIQSMVAEINKFDQIRNQDWTKVFPELAEFYKRFI
jgi:sulfatase maturation enzyme AslB (radical SAM superfamily)